MVILTRMPKKASTHLHRKAPDPLYAQFKNALTDAGVPIEYVCSVYRGNRSKFHSTLNARWRTP